MAHIKCPVDYVPLQQVTAANLNAHVNNAQLEPGAISDHPALPDPLASGDQFLVNDVSATPDVLKSITAGSLFSSGLPITTGAIAGNIGADLVITPAAGQKVDIAGNLETNDLNAVGNATIGGNLTVTGNLSGVFSGTANFTGALQVNGAVGYVLTEIVEETVPPLTLNSVANAWTVLFTSASYTKPSDEIWHIELEGILRFDITGYVSYKLKRTTGAVDLTGSCQVDHAPYGTTGKFAPLYISANENTGTSFTSTYTFEMSYPLTGYILGVGYTAIFAVTVPATKFRIYKYKTA
jgi:hypothetical protein